MPLYEYQCDVCGHRFEVIHQKFSDAPVEVCPKCGGHVEKLLSSPAIQFKGSGWYITDYARSGKSDGADVSSGKNESGGTASESKAESKETKGAGSSETAKTEAKGKTSVTPSTSD